MLVDVNQIPNKINDFATIQNNIGTWMSTLTQQPLLLDSIALHTPGTESSMKVPTALSRIPYGVVEFARSFYMDYDIRKHNKKKALTIWVQRGRDYVDLLREFVAQDFTPKTGIEVNINLMPNPNMLILGNAADDVPDIALGIGEATPADFAMRDAAQDLSSFPDFTKVFDRFIPGVRRALTYNGGTYGLPEVENFQMLFYRTDIFERLNLKVPDTWDNVFDILPTLQENGMTMNYPKADFMTQFFQNGAELYSADGLKSNLTSEAGQQAFKRWTELFSKYNLPIEIPAFYQHFRDGDIPIGVGDFSTYLQLQVAAPEITGHWKIAPLPGIKQANGQVARWSPQGVSAAMIMKKSNRKEDAWKFLNWWTSKDVQSQYAKDIESFYGIEFRWNTANIEAMKSLTWPNDDLKALREQARWAKNLPYVPGYYFLSREMEFAWNRTVMDRIPAQDSLEQAQLSLQREMNRRQKDFGINGNDSLHIQQINAPYEWGAPQ
jgi:ABC-type glycerol-3-phosphate transport system substrate-binding protein